MRKLALSGVALCASLMLAPSAGATNFFPGDPQFQVVGDITNGTVSATIGNAGIALGAFSDTFSFTIDQTGTGSGSLSTSTSIFQSPTDLDITSVIINGLLATKMMTPDNLSEFFSISSVPIIFGQLNTITVAGQSRGNGSYGGNATFIPAAADVPEPATWMMTIVGFGLIGGAMRSRSRTVRFA
ncbi:FxDxF family PEP-CTERM protein [Sphingomonas sp. BIUV-7]|uniref:FxDxF family PEP-CTERM protein n=1 Tax=Sphingomonas natans TaxID=3063330 RepID=A0ABT8YEN4_9SPHN|nr:FxDxF family PEP-CTERM protein [Sphingomonas sp. BIUV-7]MDO6416040.1 FxDxF family PEP-CTERM protein [Sphingomonas sp. BIUV-7]